MNNSGFITEWAVTTDFTVLHFKLESIAPGSATEKKLNIHVFIQVDSLLMRLPNFSSRRNDTAASRRYDQTVEVIHGNFTF
jgi:hypothetical protein